MLSTLKTQRGDLRVASFALSLKNGVKPQFYSVQPARNVVQPFIAGNESKNCGAAWPSRRNQRDDESNPLV